jgi:hypothetical protein
VTCGDWAVGGVVVRVKERDGCLRTQEARERKVKSFP